MAVMRYVKRCQHAVAAVEGRESIVLTHVYLFKLVETAVKGLKRGKSPHVKRCQPVVRAGQFRKLCDPCKIKVGQPVVLTSQ